MDARVSDAVLPSSRFHALLRLDHNGNLIDANAAAAEWFHYLGAAEALRRAFVDARERGEVSFDLHLAGRVFDISLFAQNDRFLLFGREATERRYLQARLRQDEARLRALLAAAPDAIVTVANDGRIEYINARGEAIFGYVEGSLTNGSIEAIIPEWFNARAVHAVFSEGNTACVEPEPVATVQGVRADGNRFPIELSASGLDRDGERYVSAIIRDVTEREAATTEIRLLNEHLQRHVEQLTQVNAELESFSYSVSHDLRGPLRAIAGFNALLREDYGEKLDAQGHDYLKRVQAATTRMADLIDGLLRLSRIARAELRKEPVDLSEIAHFVVEGLRREDPSRRVEVAIAPQLWAEGDRALLTVALENLIGNAWKFTAKCEQGCIRFNAQTEEGRRVYRVEDNGAGFDTAFSAKLFTPFERLHDAKEYPGTGIGLATVERIIRRHGGTLWASGKVGEGAVFYFTLS